MLSSYLCELKFKEVKSLKKNFFGSHSPKVILIQKKAEKVVSTNLYAGTGCNSGRNIEPRVSVYSKTEKLCNPRKVGKSFWVRTDTQLELYNTEC